MTKQAIEKPAPTDEEVGRLLNLYRANAHALRKANRAQAALSETWAKIGRHLTTGNHTAMPTASGWTLERPSTGGMYSPDRLSEEVEFREVQLRSAIIRAEELRDERREIEQQMREAGQDEWVGRISEFD